MNIRRPQPGRPSSVYLAFAGFVVGCLVAGLVVPLVFASSDVDVRTVSGDHGSSVATSAARAATTVPIDGVDAGASVAEADGAARGTDSASTDSGAVAGSGVRGTAGPLTASDVGVSPSSILVGAVLQDVAGAGKAGFGAAAGLSPDQQQSAYDAYFNAINAAGGINGRRVVGTYATVDIANPDSQRAACLTFTQDKKVFAVLAGPGFYNGAQCVTSENHTPLIIGDSQGIPTEWVTQANGLMATLFAASTRMMATFVDNLDSLGALRGKSIGIVSDESDAGRLARDTALLPVLAQRGYSAAYVAKLSADSATAATQVPIEVQKMRAAGVNTVLVLTNALYIVQFAQTASAQGFKPSYLVPDWGAASDAGYENMPADFDGTWISAVTTTDYNAGRPDSAADASCRQTYESATGDHLTRENSGSALRMDFTLIACDLVGTFARAATAAGANLTRSSLSSGLQSLGPYALAYWGPGSFGDGKLEYSDAVRPNRWSAGCKCWVPARPF